MFKISAQKSLCDVIWGSEVKTSDLAAHFSRNSGAANTGLFTIQTFNQHSRGAGGSGDSSRSTDSVVPGSIPWETGWWAITAALPAPWPSLEQGESSSGGSLVKQHLGPKRIWCLIHNQPTNIQGWQN